MLHYLEKDLLTGALASREIFRDGNENSKCGGKKKMTAPEVMWLQCGRQSQIDEKKSAVNK